VNLQCFTTPYHYDINKICKSFLLNNLERQFVWINKSTNRPQKIPPQMVEQNALQKFFLTSPGCNSNQLSAIFLGAFIIFQQVKLPCHSFLNIYETF